MENRNGILGSTTLSKISNTNFALNQAMYYIYNYSLNRNRNHTLCISTILLEDREGSQWLRSHELAIISKVDWMMFGMNIGLGELPHAM